VLSIKVVVNLCLMVWQNFRENQQLSQSLNERDIVSLYFPRETFLAMQGQNDLGAIIAGQPSKANLHSSSHYLTNQVFRKTYVQIKRSIDDWLRLKNLNKINAEAASDKDLKLDKKVYSSRDIISIQELIYYKLQYKSFTKNQIRSLKRPQSFPTKH
jgi:hypothetical protein